MRSLLLVAIGLVAFVIAIGRDERVIPHETVVADGAQLPASVEPAHAPVPSPVRHRGAQTERRGASVVLAAARREAKWSTSWEGERLYDVRGSIKMRRRGVFAYGRIGARRQSDGMLEMLPTLGNTVPTSLPAGRWVIRYTLQRYATGELTIDVPRDKTFVIEPVPAETVCVSLEAPDGTSLNRARRSWFTSLRVRTQSDSSGAGSRWHIRGSRKFFGVLDYWGGASAIELWFGNTKLRARSVPRPRTKFAFRLSEEELTGRLARVRIDSEGRSGLNVSFERRGRAYSVPEQKMTCDMPADTYVVHVRFDGMRRKKRVRLRPGKSTIEIRKTHDAIVVGDPVFAAE